jgi:hypothetical protein
MKESELIKKQNISNLNLARNESPKEVEGGKG